MNFTVKRFELVIREGAIEKLLLLLLLSSNYAHVCTVERVFFGSVQFSEFG